MDEMMTAGGIDRSAPNWDIWVGRTTKTSRPDGDDAQGRCARTMHKDGVGSRGRCGGVSENGRDGRTFGGCREERRKKCRTGGKGTDWTVRTHSFTNERAWACSAVLQSGFVARAFVSMDDARCKRCRIFCPSSRAREGGLCLVWTTRRWWCIALAVSTVRTRHL